MKKENFKELLVDLYSAYNPDFIKYVPQLVDKYHHIEFDAVQNILIKYNHESYTHYDALKSTDDYIHSLTKEYDAGNRSLKDFTIEMHIKRKAEKEASKTEEQKNFDDAANKKAQEQLCETVKIVKEAQNKLDESFNEINKQLDEIDKTNKIPNPPEVSIQKVSLYEDVEISIKSNYTESELIFPNKEILAGLGKGTRLIISDKNKKMIGLIIEEILYDCVSHPLGTPIIEIIINKG
jgi:hypothetical protein